MSFQTKKLNIHFNSTNPKVLQRIRTIKKRAIEHHVETYPIIDKDGTHHLILSGKPNTIRTVLGTKIKANAKRSSSFSSSKSQTRRSKSTKTPSLLQNVLERRFWNAQK